MGLLNKVPSSAQNALTVLQVPKLLKCESAQVSFQCSSPLQ